MMGQDWDLGLAFSFNKHVELLLSIVFYKTCPIAVGWKSFDLKAIMVKRLDVMCFKVKTKKFPP